MRLYKTSGITRHKATADIPAGISCTHPEVLQQIHSGHGVFIDYGKIGAIVSSSSNEEYIELQINSPTDSSKIRPEKGLNFPDSALNIPALTSEDIVTWILLLNMQLLWDYHLYIVQRIFMICAMPLIN